MLALPWMNLKCFCSIFYCHRDQLPQAKRQKQAAAESRLVQAGLIHDHLVKMQDSGFSGDMQGTGWDQTLFATYRLLQCPF